MALAVRFKKIFFSAFEKILAVCAVLTMRSKKILAFGKAFAMRSKNRQPFGRLKIIIFGHS